jgi:hypothetical protein
MFSNGSFFGWCGTYCHLYMIRSRKLERHKAEEEYKTLSAQLLSIQATVSAKKVLIFPQP